MDNDCVQAHARRAEGLTYTAWVTDEPEFRATTDEQYAKWHQQDMDSEDAEFAAEKGDKE